MAQERTFQLQLNNDQTITLKFSSIEATGDRLWQMFATTEALDTVDQLIKLSVPSEAVPVKKASVVKKTPIVKKPPVKSTDKKIKNK
jgi:hypothetical protein